MKDIAPHAWERIQDPTFPFHTYGFLLALEESGSVGPETGWLPLYLTAWKGNDLQGALLLYLKNHSYGEYIFDWEWARAYQTHGLPYYPKLTSAIPFTPATGKKILLSPDAQEIVPSLLLQNALKIADHFSCSSLHFLFLPPEEAPLFESHGFKIRHSFQYHWKNNAYSSFEDFLAALKTKKAKHILHEREAIQKAGIEISSFTGTSLTQAHADGMYQFYLSTIEKMQAIPYLNQSFFRSIFKKLPKNILYLEARKENRPIAGSFSYFTDKALYGRYWGTTEEHRNLHFELCYYRLIDFAIQNKILLFEAGAQGEHKIQRGFLPTLTYSAHSIKHPAFKKAIENFIDEEKTAIHTLQKQLPSPFKTHPPEVPSPSPQTNTSSS